MFKYLFTFFIMLTFSTTACASELGKKEAVAAAEIFILENGYTDAPLADVKRNLDHENIQWDQNRDGILKDRANSLKRKAIGIKNGRKGKSPGWSVGFDYVSERHKANCRVVTMNLDGSEIKVEHADGIRKYFAGFELPSL